MLACVCAAFVLLVGWLLYSSMYAKPRNELTIRLAKLNTTITNQNAKLTQTRTVPKKLRAHATSTLGSKYDVVDHRLRTLLTQIADSAGLTDIKPTAGINPRKRTNPGSEARSPKVITKQLDKQIDFYVLSGSLEARGSLASVLTAVELVRAQPWAHRVDSVDIKPLNTQRTLFSLSLGLQTLMMPDLVIAQTQTHMPKLVALTAEQQSRVDRLAVSSPLVLASAKPVNATPPTGNPQPAPTKAPPKPNPEAKFALWRVSGVVRRPGPVMEVWLVNTKNDTTRVLGIGQKIAGATFVQASTGKAVFEVGGARYDVRVGQTLAQRTAHDD